MVPHWVLKMKNAFDRRKYRKQGRAAFNADMPQWSCPYTDRSEACLGWHKGYEDAKVDAKLGIKSHGIARDEWERRFKARIAEQLKLASEDDPSWAIVQANELASWPVAGSPPEWTTKVPEAAAREPVLLDVLSKESCRMNVARPCRPCTWPSNRASGFAVPTPARPWVCSDVLLRLLDLCPRTS